MPRVYLTTANHHAMPPKCVCCGRDTATTLREFGEHAAAKSHRRASMQFPLCEPCMTHYVYALGKLPAGHPIPARSPECEATLCPADFVEWKGADHVIDFDSPRYARLFVEANAALKKKVWCDYEWVPPASRRAAQPAAPPVPGPFSTNLGAVAGLSWAPPPPVPNWVSTPTASAVTPSGGGVSGAFKVFVALVGLLVLSCVLVIAFAPPPPPRSTAALPSVRVEPAPAPPPADSPRRRHRSRHEAPK